MSLIVINIGVNTLVVCLKYSRYNLEMVDGIMMNDSTYIRVITQVV